MARNQDPVLDQALNDGRATIDLAPRKKAYDTVVQRQTADLPYIWLSHSRWVMAADNKLRGIQGYPLPDGGMSAGLVSGINPVTGMWLDT
jgi:ABC-type transport system substrate-binding protein